MKFSSLIQVPLILILGLFISLPFQNFAQDSAALAEENPSRTVASTGLNSSFARETSCRVTVTECPKFPEMQGVRSETFRDAHEIPLRCMDRAQHYAKVCDTTKKIKAEFVRNGTVLNETELY